MELLVEKWGNDAAVRLPEELLVLLELDHVDPYLEVSKDILRRAFEEPI